MIKIKAKNGSQGMVIFLCMLVYTIAYLGRYSYNANIGLIMDDFGVNHTEAGLVTTFFFFAYCVGQFVNGYLNKYYNKNILFSIILTISAVFNLLVFFGIPFGFIKYMWLVNGLLQSCLWPTIIAILSENIDSSNMNKATVIMSTPAALGTALIYGGSAFFAWLGNYRMTFLFSAVMLIACAIAWLVLFKPTNIVVEQKVEEKEEVTGGKMSGVVILLVVLAIFAVSNNFIKDGLSTWVPAILKEEYNMRDSLSILLTICLPIFGLFGAVFSVQLNKVISDFAVLVMALFGISLLFLGFVTLNGNVSPIVMVICFAIVLCMMHGVNNVVTAVAPLKMRGKVDSGKMAGVLNCFCYLGSTASSYGLGAIADKGGWQMVFNVLSISCIAMVVIGAIYAIGSKFSEK